MSSTGLQPTSLRRTPYIKLRTLVALFAVLASFTAEDALAVLIEFDPSAQMVVSGDQATVDVLVNPMGSFVGVFDLVVSWDDTILGLASVIVDPVNDLGFTIGDIVDNLGTTDSINVASVSLEFDPTPFQDGISAVNLFRLTFDTLAPGTSALTFSSGVLGDELGFSLETETAGGAITVAATQIPEPSILMLTGIALAGLGWIGRRGRKTWSTSFCLHALEGAR